MKEKMESTLTWHSFARVQIFSKYEIDQFTDLRNWKELKFGWISLDPCKVEIVERVHLSPGSPAIENVWAYFLY
jgi:hypothetical protein